MCSAIGSTTQAVSRCTIFFASANTGLPDVGVGGENGPNRCSGHVEAALLPAATSRSSAARCRTAASNSSRPGSSLIGQGSRRRTGPSSSTVGAPSAAPGRADVEVHAFADRPPGAGRERRPLVAPAGVPVHPLAALGAVESLRGPFDAVVYALADDEHHTGCLAALRRRRDGVVVAHQVALSELYGHAARSGALADGLDGTIRSAYGDGVHPGVGAHGVLPQREARRLGILLARDVLAHCRRLVVTRPSDATLADLDAAPADRAKVQLAGGDPTAVAEALYELVSAGGR